MHFLDTNISITTYECNYKLYDKILLKYK